MAQKKQCPPPPAASCHLLPQLGEHFHGTIHGVLVGATQHLQQEQALHLHLPGQEGLRSGCETGWRSHGLPAWPRPSSGLPNPGLLSTRPLPRASSPPPLWNYICSLKHFLDKYLLSTHYESNNENTWRPRQAWSLAFMYLIVKRKKRVETNKYTNEYVIPEKFSAMEEKNKHPLLYIYLPQLLLYLFHKYLLNID